MKLQVKTIRADEDAARNRTRLSAIWRAVQGTSTAAFVTLFLLAAPQAHAQDTKIDGPYYHEQSNSYFELHKFQASNRNQWARAHEAANRKVYKNISGHLAVIDTPEIHQFIASKFDLPGSTWFGLRYFCSVRKLMWVTGHVHKPGEFAFWDRQWAGNSKITCTQQPRMAYMGGYFIGKGNWRWRVQGIQKAYDYFIVQYKAETQG